MTQLSDSDRDAYEELAAHFQFDAGLSRAASEAQAMRFIRSPEYRRQERERREGFAAEVPPPEGRH